MELGAKTADYKSTPIHPYPRGKDYVLTAGERSELVYILQLMLNSLALYYDLPPVPLSGEYDAATQSTVESFQRYNGIAPSGTVDSETWAALAREYDETVNDSQ